MILLRSQGRSTGDFTRRVLYKSYAHFPFKNNYFMLFVKLSFILLLRFYEIVEPHMEPIVQEVTTVLREWGIIWRKLFMVGCNQIVANIS